MPELLQNAGAAAQTIKHSIANTAERTGENTGLNSIHASRYTYFFFLDDFQKLEFRSTRKWLFWVGNISLSGLAARCVTGGCFCKPWANPILWLRHCLEAITCTTPACAHASKMCVRCEWAGRKELNALIDRRCNRYSNSCSIVNMRGVDSLPQPFGGKGGREESHVDACVV